MRGHHSARRFLVIVLLLVWMILPPQTAFRHPINPRETASMRPDGAAGRLTMEAYGRVPLHFEANRGQADPQVRFLARGSGYRLFLTDTEAVLVLAPLSGVMRMRFTGARPAPEISGVEELPGKINYLLGNDSSKWHTAIPTFAKVRYRGIYPGIDLVYRGVRRQVEYDFEVAPGADPEVITLSFEGVEKLAVDPQGDLVISLPGGQLRQQRPRIFQDGDGGQKEIAGDYILRSGREVGFRVGSYDKSKPLTIDPALTYSTYLGGGSHEGGYRIAVDASGNAYVTGATLSTDFPTANALQPANAGDSDAFVTKVNADGSALVYSTYLGGSDYDFGLGIAVDASGNAYMTGQTRSTDFPTRNPVQPAYAEGITDAFVAKVNAAGSALVYSTYLGGRGGDAGYGIAVDTAGNAYVTGETSSDNFPTANPFQPGNGGGGDAFVAKVNAAGSALVYSTYLGGRGADTGSDIAVDAAGNAYVTGHTLSIDFPTVNPFQPANAGGDAFVTKVNAAGSALVYSSYLGGSNTWGSGSDVGHGIAVDAAGNAYVTGETSSTNFPTSNPIQPANAGGIDAFITKVNAAGSVLEYSTYLGGGGTDVGYGIAVDAAGNAYVTGMTSSTNFPTRDPVQPANGGAFDAFVTKVNAAGSVLVYSTYLGGSDPDIGFGVAVDAEQNAYATGGTRSINFPTAAPAQETLAGESDAFIVKLWASEGIGLYNPATGTFSLKSRSRAGPADLEFRYGPVALGWISRVGDWNSDGIDTVGLYDPVTSRFHLRNSNSAGPADVTFTYGPARAGWIPLVGDWNGDGKDTVGLFDPATSSFHLRNSNSAGPADVTFTYGPARAGWIPLVGDWNGDGVDTVGLYDPATGRFYLRNSNSAGAVAEPFTYGPARTGWIPLVGDWNSDGIDTLGLYDPATSKFHLRNSNSTGAVDVTFAYGPAGAGWVPLVGDWAIRAKFRSAPPTTRPGVRRTAPR